MPVPHGGYVASVFQQAIKTHFNTTLKKQNQPHNMILHFEYLRRTEVGTATLKVKDVKIGRQTSTIHVTLSQQDREEVFAYATNSNLSSEQGLSLPTSWQLTPARAAVDLSALEAGQDQNWAERKSWPFADFRKAPMHTRFFFPRQGQSHPSIVDQWMCLSNGENWTNQSLGYVADLFPQIVEVYSHQPVDPYSVALEETMSIQEQEKKYRNPGYWYPTLVLNLDVKKALPEEGAKWLYLRLQAKSIRNGRYDLEMVIMDAQGELVALSHHVCLAISASRNTAKRRPADKSKM